MADDVRADDTANGVGFRLALLGAIALLLAALVVVGIDLNQGGARPPALHWPAWMHRSC